QGGASVERFERTSSAKHAYFTLREAPNMKKKKSDNLLLRYLRGRKCQGFLLRFHFLSEVFEPFRHCPLPGLVGTPGSDQSNRERNRDNGIACSHEELP